MSSARADRLQTLLWGGLGLALLWLMYQLGPILTPFLLAGILAYICAPPVEVLVRRRVPRFVAVVLVMLLFILLLVTLALILVPLVREESRQLMERLPEGLALWNQQCAPWLKAHFGLNSVVTLDPETLKKFLAEHRDSAHGLLHSLLPSLKVGGLAVLGLLTNLMLTPVVMFYLLLDGRGILQRVEALVPRDWHGHTLRILTNIDAVLAEFLRGQIAVMLSLAVYYSLGLWLAGVNFALPVGILTGLLIFIPYLGYALGLILALLVALLQFDGLAPILGVAVVYGLGQGLESFALTPWLVGKRIGLHPLAVIFALLAFGQLFGFFGILLALPASAALLVALRELGGVYFASSFYQGSTPPADS
ncbi:MAG: AI-2E family transporter [Sterolibacterium sp.]|nr:AI-2E family transporter [Sterolibacterium sp.]MBP9799194.1 AI-2E family transporter [Sterolibacterium sp.]